MPGRIGKTRRPEKLGMQISHNLSLSLPHWLRFFRSHPAPGPGYDFTWRTLTPTLAKTTNINVKWRNRSCHKSELGMDNANRQPKATRRTVNAQPIRVHTLKGPSTYYDVTFKRGVKRGSSNDAIWLKRLSTVTWGSQKFLISILWGEWRGIFAEQGGISGF